MDYYKKSLTCKFKDHCVLNGQIIVEYQKRFPPIDYQTLLTNRLVEKTANRLTVYVTSHFKEKSL